MVSLTGPFEGADPTTAETRTFTTDDPAHAGAWVHDLVARLLDAHPDIITTEDAEPEKLWDDA